MSRFYIWLGQWSHYSAHMIGDSKDICTFYSGVASVSTHTSHLTTITTDHWHWSLTLTAELILTDWVFSGSLWSGATAVTSPLLTNTQTDTTDYTLGTRWSITNQSLWFTENYVECCHNILIIFQLLIWQSF